jgi:hypothetical protein
MGKILLRSLSLLGSPYYRLEAILSQRPVAILCHEHRSKHADLNANLSLMILSRKVRESRPALNRDLDASTLHFAVIYSGCQKY